MIALILEVIFRRPIQLLFMLLVPPIIATVIAYFLPVSYQATGTLWALRRYHLVSATGPESNTLATPAETQVDVITELLQSHTFVLTVAREARLESALHLDASGKSDRQHVEDILFNNISRQVQVVPLGYNLFSVTYIGDNPAISQQIVKAVIHNYGVQSQLFANTEGKILLQSYGAQYESAKEDRNMAANMESQYLALHPELKSAGLTPLQVDPQYNLLHSQTLQTQGKVDELHVTIMTINGQITTGGDGFQTLFQIVDTPVKPSHPISRIKVFSMGAGVGFGIGILASILYIVILVRRDYGVYSALGLQKTVQTSVVVQIPILKIKGEGLAY